MYYKSIALKVPELHVSPHKLAAFKVSGGSTRSKGTTCPKQRRNIIVRIVLIKKTTQVDKYLRKHRTRRIYTRRVLVTITQNVPDKRTRRSKNHFVSISVSSSLTKVTLEWSDDNFHPPNTWEGKETKHRHTGSNKSHETNLFSKNWMSFINLICMSSV